MVIIINLSYSIALIIDVQRKFLPLWKHVERTPCSSYVLHRLWWSLLKLLHAFWSVTRMYWLHSRTWHVWEWHYVVEVKTHPQSLLISLNPITFLHKALLDYKSLSKFWFCWILIRLIQSMIWIRSKLISNNSWH